MDCMAQHTSMPREIQAGKARMPAAYLGLGILEWHGEHNVAGLDGVKANGMAMHFARKFGGVVMPPLFWGDHRGDICELVFKPELFPEAVFDHTPIICEKIGYQLEDLEKNARRSGRNGGWRLWMELVVHMFFEIESFGYKCIIPIPGHYPMFSPLDEAIGKYRDQGGTCDVFVVKDPMYSDTGNAGDHAAKFETSLMMCLHPEMVDLSRLDPDTSNLNIGVLGEDPRLYASKEFGLQVLDKLDGILENHFREIGLLRE
jgi:creatinine amidohydrolase